MFDNVHALAEHFIGMFCE